MFYAIEDRIRGLSATQRAAVRQSDTRPLIEDFKPWLEARLLEVSKKSGLGKAIRYTLNHWEGLTRFIDDGRIEIDNSAAERAPIRYRHPSRGTISLPILTSRL